MITIIDLTLFRNNCTIDELLTIFENPDIHTGYGYYKQPRSIYKQGITTRYSLLLDKPWNEINDLLSYTQNTLKKYLNHSRIILQERLDENKITNSLLETTLLDHPPQIIIDINERDHQLIEDLKQKSCEFCTWKLKYSNNFPNNKDDCICVAIGNTGGYVVIMNNGSCHYHNIPDQLHHFIERNMYIDYIALGDENQYYIRAIDGTYEISEACKQSFGDKCESILNYPHSIPIFIAFGPIGIFYIKYMNRYHIFNGIYSKLYCICKYENIVHLWIGRNDVYFVTYMDNVDNNSYKMFYSKHGFISNVIQFIQNTSKYFIRQLLISMMMNLLHFYKI